MNIAWILNVIVVVYFVTNSKAERCQGYRNCRHERGWYSNDRRWPKHHHHHNHHHRPRYDTHHNPYAMNPQNNSTGKYESSSKDHFLTQIVIKNSNSTKTKLTNRKKRQKSKKQLSKKMKESLNQLQSLSKSDNDNDEVKYDENPLELHLIPKLDLYHEEKQRNPNFRDFFKNHPHKYIGNINQHYGYRENQYEEKHQDNLYEELNHHLLNHETIKPTFNHHHQQHYINKHEDIKTKLIPNNDDNKKIINKFIDNGQSSILINLKVANGKQLPNEIIVKLVK